MNPAPSQLSPQRGVDSSALRRLAAVRPLPLQVVGCCMAPTLIDGDVVAVEPARFFLPGDVIAYRQPQTGRLLVHRFLGYRRSDSGWALLAQGDGCTTHDGWISPEQVIGRARFRNGDGYPLTIPLADRIRAMGRWWHLALAWLARRLA
jgi:hypothetical protein